MEKGVLYGVSVGPGDPELMTVKAVRTIERCSVIATPRTGGTRTLALDIASGLVDLTAKNIVYLDFKMTNCASEGAAIHEELASRVFSLLDEGLDVALLNLGDATLFGTWSYIEQIALDRGYETETISGVTSFCASAAKLHTSLTVMDKPLHIIPGHIDNLARELSLSGTKVLMKSSRALPQVEETLAQLGLDGKASMVVNCGLPDERICPKMQVLGDEGYFVTILVKD